MAAFSRALPRQFDQPLPLMMAQLTPPTHSGTVIAKSSSRPLAEAEIRRLADAVAAWHLSSPLGICLRRSLLRYYFLREKGLPLRIIFGARLKSGQEGGGIGGHAWLTLHGLPYYENRGDYEGFVEMYHYPPDEEVKVKAASQFEKS
jgi:hypothetical protein